MSRIFVVELDDVLSSRLWPDHSMVIPVGMTLLAASSAAAMASPEL